MCYVTYIYNGIPISLACARRTVILGERSDNRKYVNSRRLRFLELPRNRKFETSWVIYSETITKGNEVWFELSGEKSRDQ